MKQILIQLLLAAVALELLSWFVSQQKLLLFNSTPPVYGAQLTEPARTERHPWGVWRNPHSTSRHTRLCFDVEVSTNELGARDDSFKNSPRESLILLGDSFAEGFGVSHSDSTATILEKRIQRPVLNLGTAGNFGPLQQYLIYREYGEIIQHSAVIIFVLPANDFTDNEIGWWSGSEAQRRRYRPYYGAENPLSPVYHAEAIPSQRLNYEKRGFSLVGELKNALVRYTWSANSLRTLMYLLNPPEPYIEQAPKISSYEKASPQQQQNFIAAYQAISDTAADRPIFFVIIPEQRDIEYYTVHHNDRSYKSQAWFIGLHAIADPSGGKVLDLLDYLPRNYKNLFHSCDGHWSEEGNKWAAEKIYEIFFR